MNGWQRVGVVLSVLWAIGLPTYLVKSNNWSVDAKYANCSHLAAQMEPDKIIAAATICANLRDLAYTNFSQEFRDRSDLYVILVPIVLL